MRRLIVTGDDFGLAVPVNEAIEEAHREGILTAASLMVSAAAAGDAVERAHRLGSLRVGLHVVLVEGKPTLPAAAVPDLVDERGELGARLLRAGVAFFFRPRVRRQLEAEIRGQFEAFRGTGLRLDHVNAHNHMHLHPTVLGLLLKVGREYGLSAVRVPSEPPLVSWRAAGTAPARRLLTGAFLAPWVALLRWRLARAGLKSNEFTFGLHDSGHVHAALLGRFIQRLPEGVTEIYLHPATRRCPELDRHMSGYQQKEELEALKSPVVKAALLAGGVERIAFADI